MSMARPRTPISHHQRIRAFFENYHLERRGPGAREEIARRMGLRPQQITRIMSYTAWRQLLSSLRTHPEQLHELHASLPPKQFEWLVKTFDLRFTHTPVHAVPPKPESPPRQESPVHQRIPSETPRRRASSIPRKRNVSATGESKRSPKNRLRLYEDIAKPAAIPLLDRREELLAEAKALRKQLVTLRPKIKTPAVATQARGVVERLERANEQIEIINRELDSRKETVKRETRKHNLVKNFLERMFEVTIRYQRKRIPSREELVQVIESYDEAARRNGFPPNGRALLAKHYRELLHLLPKE